MIWKTFAGRCIHRGSNGIQVHQNLAYRWLTFDSNAVQTLINLRHPERPGLQYVQALTLAARAKPDTSCLLGLGGAGVAHTLAPCFAEFRLDVVESNLDVMNIASAYFMTNQIKNMNVIHQDAFLHVQQTDTYYQHLMVDLFNAHSFPEHCNNPAFFGHCQRILLPDGILAVNLANPHEYWPIFMRIREHFKLCTVSIPVKGTENMVVLAYKSDSVKPLLTLLENHSDVKQLLWDSQWGYMAQVSC